MVTGAQIAFAALKYQGIRYVFGAKGVKGRMPKSLDCSGLVKLTCDEAGVPMPHGSVQQRDHCRRYGRKISLEEAARTPGALFFRIGRGSTNHVAFSLGNGSTMEAQSKKTGVGVFGKALSRPWTEAYLIPHVNYAKAAPTPAVQPANPFASMNLYEALAFMLFFAKQKTYRRGDRNVDVKFIRAGVIKFHQNVRNGVSPWLDDRSELFDEMLEKWVKWVQGSAGLPQTGVVDARTWSILWP